MPWAALPPRASVGGGAPLPMAGGRTDPALIERIERLNHGVAVDGPEHLPPSLVERIEKVTGCVAQASGPTESLDPALVERIARAHEPQPRARAALEMERLRPASLSPRSVRGHRQHESKPRRRQSRAPQKAAGTTATVAWAVAAQPLAPVGAAELQMRDSEAQQRHGAITVHRRAASVGRAERHERVRPMW